MLFSIRSDRSISPLILCVFWYFFVVGHVTNRRGDASVIIGYSWYIYLYYLVIYHKLEYNINIQISPVTSFPPFPRHLWADTWFLSCEIFSWWKAILNKYNFTCGSRHRAKWRSLWWSPRYKIHLRWKKWDAEIRRSPYMLSLE